MNHAALRPAPERIERECARVAMQLLASHARLDDLFQHLWIVGSDHVFHQVTLPSAGTHALMSALGEVASGHAVRLATGVREMTVAQALDTLEAAAPGFRLP
jgi:hypothetical protein